MAVYTDVSGLGRIGRASTHFCFPPELHHSTFKLERSHQPNFFFPLESQCLAFAPLRAPIFTTSSFKSNVVFFTSIRPYSIFAAGPALSPYSKSSSRVALTPLQRRTYAKKKKMPPKKAVKEEKVYLGRPGNNLKSGIVCREPSQRSKAITNAARRSVWLTLESPHCSSLSQNAISATPPISHSRPSTRKKPRSLYPMQGSTRCASSINQNHKSLPI